MVRDANFADIPAMVAVLYAGYLKSHYAGDDRVEFDVREAKRLLMQAIQRHGHLTGGGTWVQVAESNGTVTGLIVGTLSRVYAIGTRLMATDLFWVACDDVDPLDPARLMRNMMAWARSNPDVIEVKCGTTAIIRDDPAAAGVILERLGMKQYGNIYRMDTRL
ncbi:MAG: hypothetical protein KDJ36_09180 [Hyphomicrobiaceae bacterium]|nr:hypothetical protein [Hyphomicrobiaceae bacterium]